MATKITMDPITRLEGHLKIEVNVDTVNGTQQVIDAWTTGTMYRGMENLLNGRDPLDAPHFTQRICGVCPVAHSLASVSALDNAYGLAVPNNGRLLRNLVLGANFVQSHILHFYHLAAPDYINGPNMPPWQPGYSADRRVDDATSKALIDHYVQALAMRRKAHEMGAIFGGRMPDPPAYLPGGFTAVPKTETKTRFKTYLNELVGFVQNIYIPDVLKIGQVYSDYAGIGGGRGNLLAYGVFDLDGTGNSKLLKRGRAIGGQPVSPSSTTPPTPSTATRRRRNRKNLSASPETVTAMDPYAITEEVTHGWYAPVTDKLNPSNGETVPQYPKNGAYSWLKAPRYLNEPYEVGALARMVINGDYNQGISVIDRHAARALETKKIAEAMLGWIDQVVPGQPAFTSFARVKTTRGIGLTEAPRGALGHWLEIFEGKLSHYQVLTPTCWNASPRDGAGVRGPIEEALIGTPVKDPAQPVEVLRVIHSFDPCLSCAVHIIRPGKGSTFSTVLTV